MAKHPAKVSIYRIAKDLGMSPQATAHHVQALVDEGVVAQDEEGYCLNDCLRHPENHVEFLAPLVQSLAECNPTASEEVLTTLVEYLLALVTFEVT
jgi:biotin operon repressor